jgi:type I restriction enzyme, R subunit
MKPEEKARQQIDLLLQQCGWLVQDYRQVDLSAGSGIAIREVPMKEGKADYLLLVDRKAVGIIEAKKLGTLLSGVAEQSAQYAESLPDWMESVAPGRLPFVYESTGAETFFTDYHDPDPRARNVFAFHRPEMLREWASQSTSLRARLRQMPILITNGMRQCQIEAIRNLEESFAENHPRALIQMATGAGKTFTAVSFIYRLIKHAGAQRVLFLVDRSNLGRQTVAEFQQYTTPDTGRKFTEIYNIQHLASSNIDPVARVTVSTIQRLYSVLRGEELTEDVDEISGFELASADSRPREVQYNSRIPIEMFDFIVTDECHRSIYDLWRQVLEYFDAFLIGLTATPSKQTIGFFRQNLVMEYGHERAVSDGVNVGYDVYRIRTQVTEEGGQVERGLYIDRRSKETRKTRWERLDEDLGYGARDLDRSVVVPSQIRTVLQMFKDVLFTELFPGRKLVPKTLIFAKDDSHAEDIVHICREVFGKGNDFCKKITYKTYNPETKRYEKSESLIQEFRTSPQLRIAVTVDMIATGTDIRPLECLLFFRDVRSRVYFEQMKGRGTRVLSPTDLQAVSGAEATAKTHFVIVDAVGVCESDKTESRPLERKPSLAFDKLLLGVALGKRDEDSLTTLAGRLARLDRALSEADRRKVEEVSGGSSLTALSGALLRAIDPDSAAEAATGKPGVSPDEVDASLFQEARKNLIADACAPFDNPLLRDTLAKLKKDNEQTIDVVTVDNVLDHRFDAAAKEKAESLVRSFKEYIEQHRNEIAALQILYSRPYRQRLTEECLRELEEKLKPDFGAYPVESLWLAFSQFRQRPSGSTSSATRRFTDLVSLVRVALEQEPLLAPFEQHVRTRFSEWLEKKRATGVTFTEDQMAWLKKMRDYVSASGSVDRDHLEADNVLGPIFRTFGEQLWPLMEELNLALAA